MMHAVYNLVLILATPLLAFYVWLRPKYRVLLHRFSPKVPQLDSQPIWIQGASVGEVLSAKSIIEGLKQAYAGVPIVLTTGTASGMEEAVKWCDPKEVAWFPFDHPWCVRMFFKRLNPRCIVLIETEIWPNVLHRAHRNKVPVVIVNGRLSEKNFGTYERYKIFFNPYLAPVALAAMQSILDSDRIQVLGVPTEAIRITGNLKFDGASLESDEDKLDSLRTELGIETGMQVLVFGSTRPGEERAFLECWERLKVLFPHICLIVAPRHLKRLNEVVGVFSAEVVHMRSALSGATNKVAHGDVIILDTLGELKAIYGLATVAVIGGSFSVEVQGHNPIESAALGIPTVFGPHMKNFLQVAEILVQSGGAIQVEGMESLLPALESLLGDGTQREGMGELGQDAVRDNQGALAKTIEFMKEVVE